jgi:hypothetical protein
LLLICPAFPPSLSSASSPCHLTFK